MPVFNRVRRGQSQSRSTTGSTPEKTIDVTPPTSVGAAEAEKAARGAVDKLVRTITSLKDVDGRLALEGYGKGDPRVTERRGALATLLAEKTGRMVDEQALRSISAEIAKDIDFLRQTDRREYTIDGRGQFEWYRPYNNPTVDVAKIESEFAKRIDGQKQIVKDLLAGRRTFMDVGNMSMAGLGLIAEPALRAAAMMDALLQFRARTDKDTQREDGWVTRIDRFGVALLAEQRAVLGMLDLSNARDYALIREVISSHPISSTNQIFDARNAVSSILIDQGRYRERELAYSSPTAWIRNEVPPGATSSPYTTIHHNFSRDTPRNIRLFVEEWMFPLGPRDLRGQTFLTLVSAMAAARRGDVDAALHSLSMVPAAMKLSVPAIAAALQHVPQAASGGAGGNAVDLQKLADVLRDTLVSACKKNLGDNKEKNLEMAARLYAAVCSDQPGLHTLEQSLFRAGEAWPAIADVMVALARKDDLSALRELGEARLALRDAIVKSKSGYERHELIKLDAQLSRMTNEHLGAAVDRLNMLDTDAKKAECLLAVQTALRSALASGLDAIVADDDAHARPRALREALAAVDNALSTGRVTETEYRRLMSQVTIAVRSTVQSIRHFADKRAAEVARGGVPIDPEFIDQFIKQSPLHYATALAEKGLRVGLVEKIGPKKIENVTGMRVLNGIGPVVFTSVVFAENSKQLAEMGTTKDQLAILYHLEEKKMVAVGGLFVDTEHAPGGNSHLNMYAMNNGIPVVALPELRTKYAELFKNAAKEGGLYIDDSGDGFVMMTVAEAKREGRITGSIDTLRPGVNRRITFLKPTSDGRAFEVAGRHDAIINDKRKTREVELYIPQEQVRGIGRGVPTFDELAALGLHARHLAGEKGTVLALLAQHPKLKKHIPQGSVITFGDIRDLLAAAKTAEGKTLLELWDAVWTKDPKVGVVDDRNFLQSAFYTDPAYRKRMRERLAIETRQALEKLLIDTSKVPPGLTAAGKKLYDNIMRNPALRDEKTGSIIFRSSFTGEDRPGKSGAGQYESYVDRKVADKLYGKPVVDAAFTRLKQALDSGDAARIKRARDEHNAFMAAARIVSAIGVIESAWMPEPIENNVAEQFFLKHIGPTCVVQACMTPDISGVMISRDIESGARNAVHAQIVKGFGGGVDGGKATEVLLRKGGNQVRFIDGEPAPAGAKVTVGGLEVSNKDLEILREIVLETEAFFHENIEKGKGYAVDMEVARQDGEWKIVQARVILMDK